MRPKQKCCLHSREGQWDFTHTPWPTHPQTHTHTCSLTQISAVPPFYTWRGDTHTHTYSQSYTDSTSRVQYRPESVNCDFGLWRTEWLKPAHVSWRTHTLLLFLRCNIGLYIGTLRWEKSERKVFFTGEEKKSTHDGIGNVEGLRIHIFIRPKDVFLLQLAPSFRFWQGSARSQRFR